MIYNITTSEIIELLGDLGYGGFSEEEIKNSEKNLGISLPKVYRNYLKKYGRHAVNQFYNHLFEPSEIMTSYECIEKTLEDFGFTNKKLSETELEKYKNNDYLVFHNLPKEKWDTITENYVLIWCENQGVWNAGYLLSDLKKGVENPPVYMTNDDDFISFFKAYDDTEIFLMEMLGQALQDNILQDETEIKNFLIDNNIDLLKIKRNINGDYCLGNCWDKRNNKLYFYYSYNNYTQLNIVDVK